MAAVAGWVRPKPTTRSSLWCKDLNIWAIFHHFPRQMSWIRSGAAGTLTICAWGIGITVGYLSCYAKMPVTQWQIFVLVRLDGVWPGKVIVLLYLCEEFQHWKPLCSFCLYGMPVNSSSASKILFYVKFTERVAPGRKGCFHFSYMKHFCKWRRKNTWARILNWSFIEMQPKMCHKLTKDMPML